MSGPLVQAIIGHLDSVYSGPNGDYVSILEALEGVTMARALWRPIAECNSIWQIVDHLAASKDWLTGMIENGRADTPVWAEPSGGEEAWLATQERLSASHARLKTALSRLADDELLSSIDPQTNQTLLELILSGGPAHEAHHGGQIDYLKGMQGRD